MLRPSSSKLEGVDTPVSSSTVGKRSVKVGEVRAYAIAGTSAGSQLTIMALARTPSVTSPLMPPTGRPTNGADVSPKGPLSEVKRMIVFVAQA